MARAAQDHAGNANEGIMYGLESIGHLLSSYGAREEVDARHVGHLGDLVQMLAVQAQYLQDVDQDMRVILDAHDCQQRGPTTARKGAKS
jgi:hypothetical protein